MAISRHVLVLVDVVVPVVSIRATVKALEQLGVQTTDLQLSLPADDLGLVPRMTWEALIQRASEALDRPTAAMEVGMAVPWGSLGVIDYLVGTSADVASGLHSLEAHFKALASGIGFELLLRDEEAWVRFIDTGEASAWDLEFSIGLLVSRFHGLAAHFKARAASLRRRRAAGFDALLGVEPAFGAEHDGIALEADVLADALVGADPHLHETLQSVSRRLSLGTEGPDLELAIRARLRDLLAAGGADLPTVARCLGQSPRTLSRRLEAEGRTFRQIVDSFRADESERLLLTGQVSLAQIAEDLGYGDQSAWTKAFRRWRGVTPRAWLDRARRRQ